jgi:hypothetical protein
MAIDFFGVRLSGRIRQFPKGHSANGRTVELWTQPQEAHLSEFKALAFVSQVTVEHKMGDHVKLAMVLTPPYEDGLLLLQSELVRFGVGRLEIEFGYSTGTTDTGGAVSFTQLPFSGFLQKPDVTIGKDISITLNAEGMGYQMNVVGGTETKNFPLDYTWAQAVEETLKKYVMEDGGSKSLNISKLYADIPQEVKDVDPFFSAPATSVDRAKGKSAAPVPEGVISKGPRNDWWFVRETIENFGYDLIVFGNEVKIIEKTKYFETQMGDSKKTRKKFLLRGNVDPTRNMFPILSFSSTQEGPWLSPGVGKLLMHDWPDAKGTKDPSVNETHAGTVESGAGADGKLTKTVDVDGAPDAVASGEVIQGGANFPGDPNNPEDRKKAEANWKDLQMSDGIVGDFTTIGIPGLRPGEAVDVSGFEAFGDLNTEDALFNGVYGIQVVRHQVGVGGWTTSFTGCIGAFHKDSMLAKAKANKVAVAKAEKVTAAKESFGKVTRVPIDPTEGTRKPSF